jgi:hypothetical protein
VDKSEKDVDNVDNSFDLSTFLRKSLKKLVLLASRGLKGPYMKKAVMAPWAG